MTGTVVALAAAPAQASALGSYHCVRPGPPKQAMPGFRLLRGHVYSANFGGTIGVERGSYRTSGKRLAFTSGPFRVFDSGRFQRSAKGVLQVILKKRGYPTETCSRR